MALAYFVGFLVLLVLGGKLVALFTGARTRFVEAFVPDDGEAVLWTDLAADVFVVPRHRARVNAWPRLRRGAVIVTNRRIVAGTRALFDSRHVLEYMLYPSDRAFPNEARAVGGGVPTRGYATYAFDRTKVRKNTADERPSIDLFFDASTAVADYNEWIRIYTDDVSGFALPDEP